MIISCIYVTRFVDFSTADSVFVDCLFVCIPRYITVS